MIHGMAELRTHSKPDILTAEMTFTCHSRGLIALSLNQSLTDQSRRGEVNVPGLKSHDTLTLSAQATYLYLDVLASPPREMRVSAPS